MPNTPSLNLLRSQGKGFLYKLINWALKGGRVIVIVTEAVALFAFLYRFSLDMKLTDLNTKIKQQQNIVAYSKSNEDKFRNLQERLFQASTLSKKGEETVKILDDIVKLAPADLTFSSLTITEDRLLMNATVQSSNSLTTFINALKAYPKINGVSLDKIENRTQSARIVVNISANFKKINLLKK